MQSGHFLIYSGYKKAASTIHRAPWKPFQFNEKKSNLLTNN